MMLRQSTPEPETNQLYEKEPITEVANSGASENPTKPPDHSNSDLESRQQHIVAPHNSSR